MKPLLGREGRLALQAVMRRRPLLAFDFDGTLAPIVSRPDDARVPVSLSRRLERLARLVPVAIVTGRSVDDVTPRLGFVPHYIVGNHGAEDPLARRPAPERAHLDAVRRVLADHADRLEHAGVTVEDKGFSLALHYRLAKDRARAAAAIDEALQGLDPSLRTFGGKCVVNVVAADAPDKADAVLALVERSEAGAAVFVGDDVNDEVVFERAPPGWLTVRIGRHEQNSKAAYMLETHAEVATLLQEMLALLTPA
jgi:trehalose 6-phosphate phosphatase